MKKIIINIIKDVLEQSEKEISLEKKIKDLDIDSLEMYEILMKIEENFKIEFISEEIMKIKTINDIVEIVKEKI